MKKLTAWDDSSMNSQEEIKSKIKLLVDKYEHLVKTDQIKFYNEERTKAEFIEPLFEILGWDVRNIHTINEVSREEPVSKNRVDYGFRINNIPKFFLEAKALNKRELLKPQHIKQAIDYSWLKGTTWAILTDFREIAVFNAEVTSDVEQTSNRLFLLKCDRYTTDDFDQIMLLTKDNFREGKLDKLAEKWDKKRRKNPIDKQLLSDFTIFREELSKSINKNNKIDQHTLDECVQRILDRLIFIRVCEDREIEPPILQTKAREWDWKSSNKKLTHIMSEIFRKFDEKYNSELFRFHECEKLVIESDILLKIINGLYSSPQGPYIYDFSAIEADALGNIYEQYLGHILKKTEKRTTLKEAKTHRKEQGVYYTPTYIVDYIVKNTITEYTKDKSFDQVLSIKILDPACGSGSFLIKAFSEMCLIIENRMKKGEKSTSHVSFKNYSGRLTLAQKISILQNCIFGVDLDEQATEIVRLNLLLRLLQGESQETLSNIKDMKKLLPMLTNIKCGNSLIDDEKIAGNKVFKWEKEFSEIMKEGGFDVIIGNPPYVRIQTLDKKEVDFFNKSYESATKNYDIYALFVEKSLKLLRPNGTLGFILPTKFFTADYGEGLRKVITKNKCLYKIVDFKDFQVFDDATTYTCLLFLRKKENKSFEYDTFADGKKLKLSKVLKDDMLEKSEIPHPKGSEPWQFVSSKDTKIFDKLNSIQLKLKGISENIFQGIITGSDKVYILIKRNKEFYSVATKKSYKLEAELLHPLLKGSRHIRRYKIEPSEKYVIFPYRILSSKAIPISESELEKKYPILYRYLLENKNSLEKRDSGKMKGENWYLFSRNQNLTRFGQEKIMTPSIAKEPSFTYDSKSDFFFVGSGGGGGGAYGITLKKRELYLYILGILNSKLVSFFIKNTSSKFSGGFFAFNRQYIENIPIIIAEGSVKKKVEELVSKQLKNHEVLIEIGDKKIDKRTLIEEEIKANDKIINELIYKIYGITENGKNVIEEMK